MLLSAAALAAFDSVPPAGLAFNEWLNSLQEGSLMEVMSSYESFRQAGQYWRDANPQKVTVAWADKPVPSGRRMQFVKTVQYRVATGNLFLTWVAGPGSTSLARGRDFLREKYPAMDPVKTLSWLRRCATLAENVRDASSAIPM